MLTRLDSLFTLLLLSLCPSRNAYHLTLALHCRLQTIPKNGQGKPRPAQQGLCRSESSAVCSLCVWMRAGPGGEGVGGKRVVTKLWRACFWLAFIGQYSSWRLPPTGVSYAGVPIGQHVNNCSNSALRLHPSHFGKSCPPRLLTLTWNNHGHDQLVSAHLPDLIVCTGNDQFRVGGF